MGKLVVIEGLDGAGKRTLAESLTAAFSARGATVTRVAFPRYGRDVHADLVSDALYGRLGDLSGSVHGMALLFALDRMAAADPIREDLAGHDIVLLDRYIASNAAYGAARLYQDGRGEFVSWVRELEVDRFGSPVPDAHLLLRVPVAVAVERAQHRERTEDRARDAFEADGGLQVRCATVYQDLVADSWLAPWRSLDGTSTVDFDGLADELLG